MNRLVLIGNGFDLAHGLKTSYKDFIYWYWKQRVLSLSNFRGKTSDDGLCKFKMAGASPLSSCHHGGVGEGWKNI